MGVSAQAGAQDGEAYEKMHDRLLSLPGFQERPVLFIIGIDTSKSMSVQLDRAKQLTQTFLSRYAVPGDGVHLFGFTSSIRTVAGTDPPVLIPADQPEAAIASLNESLLGLGFSSEVGTVFTRAKLHSLDVALEHGQGRNVVILLFADNYSEVGLGTDEGRRLEEAEASTKAQGETFPLLSDRVSPLWLTLYVNEFPDSTALQGPMGQEEVRRPRLAWASRRIASQSLEFVAPESETIDRLPVEVVLRFVGFSEVEEVTLSVDGAEALTAPLEDGGLATFELDLLEQGSRVLFAQAVFTDGKVRTAERTVRVTAGSGGGPPAAESPSPGEPTPSPLPSPGEIAEPEDEGGGAPWVLLLLLVGGGAVFYLLSTKPVDIRVIGPDSEKSFHLVKGQQIQIGGKALTESDLVFPVAGADRRLAMVRSTGFGRACVFPSVDLEEGSVELETDEGQLATEGGEPLLTNATLTWTDGRGRKHVIALSKEENRAGGSEQSSSFGAGAGEEESDDGADWRA